MKKILILTWVTLVAFNLNAYAQHYYAASRQLQHYIGFSIGGGEANNFLKNPDFDTKIGGAGNAMFHYELWKQNFFFSLGLGADFQHTQMAAEAFMDTRVGMDMENEQLTYQYRFTNYLEKNDALLVAAQVMCGYKVANNIYLALGAKIKAPVWANYSTTTDLQVTGQYDRWAAEFIANRPAYGFYEKDVYASNGKVASMNALVAPTIEIGGVVPVGKKSMLRAGLYADYGFAIGNHPTKQLIDYSKVNLNPLSQSQADLKQNILLRSVFDSNVAGAYSNLEIGLRVVFLFDVTVHHEPCHCVKW